MEFNPKEKRYYMPVYIKHFLSFAKTFLFFSFIFTIQICGQEKGIYIVENEAIKRSISTTPFVSTTLLKNKYTGKEFSVISDEFTIMLNDYKADFSGPVLSTKDFIVDGKIIRSADGTELSIPLYNKENSLKVILHYEAKAKFYMHKWLEIFSASPKCNVSVIEVERMKINGVQPSHPSLVYGENTEGDGPVYADNFFLGLEFPKQDNSFDNGFIRLRHFPGCDMTEGKPLLSKKSVLGASPDKPLKRLKDCFLEYIDDYRNPKVRNYKVYNTWFLLDFRQKEDTLLEAIETHVKPLYDRGIKLDGFVVDDGWQDKNTLWQVNNQNIPTGIGPEGNLQKSLKKYECNLHLWQPLTGQYGLAERRKEAEWYEARGYETGINWSLCLAPGNKIFKDKKERLIEIIRDGITSMKADFALLGCNKPGHHHLPNAQYGMEANINGIIDIIEALRKENPSLFYYLTTAINKSPWWLGTNDVLWESFWDDIKYYSDNYEPTPAQIRMSGRDEWHWQRNMKWFVPQTSYMTHGIIGCNDKQDELYCSLQEMIDVATLYYARGVMWSEIYVTSMDSVYWDALADVIKWADKNRAVLIKQPAMSGGPSSKSPYYWSHFNADTGLIIVRNPTPQERGINIPLNEFSRMEYFDGRKYKAEVAKISKLSQTETETLGYYQYGDTVQAMLKPWQMKVIEIKPVEKTEPVLMVSAADINFGMTDINSIKESYFTVKGGDGDYNVTTGNAPWLKILNGSTPSIYKAVIDTKDLQFNKLYNGKITVSGRVAGKEMKKEISVFFRTPIDPKAPVLYLSDLDVESHNQTYGTLGRDKTINGNPITLAGQKYEKGLGSHSNAETIFNLEKLNVKSFHAIVGLDDEVNGTVEFWIYRDFGNGFEKDAAFTSGVMRKGDKPKAADIDLTGTRRIMLKVGSAKDGIDGDHADWGDAQFKR